MKTKTKKVEQPNNVQNTQEEIKKIDKEKNIIERTKEVREISKRIKNLYDNYVIDSFLSMRRILSFLTLPYRTRFVQDSFYIERMLIDEKVLVPGLYDTNENELLYNEWCCKKIEEGKQIMKDYRNTEEKIYRYLFDYIIIENEAQRDETVTKVGENLEKLKKLAHSEVLDELYYTRQEIWDFESKLWEEKIINDKTEYISREKAIEYTNKVIENTIKRYPKIVQQDSSEIWRKYHNFEPITYFELEFEDIERELDDEIYDELYNRKSANTDLKTE